MHGCRLAQALGMPTAIMPAAAGVASAIGLLSADVKFDLVRTYLTDLASVDASQLSEIFADMEQEASGVIAESTGAPPARIVREVDLRYVGQGYELTIGVPEGALSADVLSQVRQAFEDAYARRYGFSSPDQRVEATTWKLTAYGYSQTVELPRYERQVDSQGDAVTEVRSAYFPELGGYTDTRVYDRYLLFPGARVDGPAIVEERESTTVIPPGMTAVADEHANLIVEVS
jgi:N-methylhydantoinase A